MAKMTTHKTRRSTAMDSPGFAPSDKCLIEPVNFFKLVCNLIELRASSSPLKPDRNCNTERSKQIPPLLERPPSWWWVCILSFDSGQTMR